MDVDRLVATYSKATDPYIATFRKLVSFLAEKGIVIQYHNITKENRCGGVYLCPDIVHDWLPVSTPQVPHILIHRPRSEYTEFGMAGELFVLAHEAGHWYSWTQKTKFQNSEIIDAYAAIGSDDITEDQKQLILEEERFASFRGEQYLREFYTGTYDDYFWDYIAKSAKHNIKKYKKKLKLHKD